jgi:hypothetical protein
MTELLNAPRFRVASRRRASRSGVRALTHRPDSPPAFCGRVRQLPFDEPDEQPTPRQSGDDPGVRPDEPVLWSGRVRAGHPSSPGGPRSGPRRTGHQYPVTGCAPMSVSPTSVPRLAHRPSVRMHNAPSESATGPWWHGSVPRAAHRPSVPLAGVESCPAFRALIHAGGQVPCVDLRDAWVRFTRISESLPTPHFILT